MKQDHIDMIIITGLSGAGKTQALRCLEDLGYFCVDNLPPLLIPRFAKLFEHRGPEVEKIALVMDIRGGRFFEGLTEALDYLDTAGFAYDLLFLEASDEALVRRYKETRRRHPLSEEGRIMEGIIEERKRVEELRGRAGKIIDTSELSPRMLREQIVKLFARGRKSKLVVTIMSFGFKYGIPLDADLVVDVRFLPNPYYVESLRFFTGMDQKVRDYVLNSTVTQKFLRQYTSLLKFLIPYYIQEGKNHLVIAVGCTGGQHRSVTLAEEFKAILEKEKVPQRLTLWHRDIRRNAGERGIN